MILVNGDSITFGHGLSQNQKSWPKLLLHNYKNIAQPGSSNHSIFRRSLEELYLNQYDVLIVAWSGLYRFEWADNYGQAKTFLLNQHDNRSDSANVICKELLLNWHNKFWYFKNFLFLLSSLNLHCKQLGIRFYCLQSGIDLAECYTNCQNLNNFTNDNLDREFISIDDFKKEYEILKIMLEETKNCWILDPTISITEFYGSNIISSDDLHPTQQGHQMIADNLANLFRNHLDKYTKLE